MSLTQIDHGFLGLEIKITPDDKYEYLSTKNYHDNSHMFIRRSGDLINIWNTQKGEWHPKDFSFREMKNKDQLIITIITSDFSITLPSKNQAYAHLNRNNN